MMNSKELHILSQPAPAGTDPWTNCDVDNTMAQYQMEAYTRSTCEQAEEKLRIWKKIGIEVLLRDDDEKLPEPKTRVSLKDVENLIVKKYDLLRHKLFQKMITELLGVDNNASRRDRVYEENIKELKRNEMQYRDSDSLQDNVSSLFGSQLSLSSCIKISLGDLHNSAYSDHNLLDSELKLINDSGNINEICQMIKHDFYKAYKEKTSCSDILIKLHERERQERDQISFLFHSTSPTKTNPLLAYLLLFRQTAFGNDFYDFSTSCLAIGLAERKQGWITEPMTWDRLRCEVLASFLLSEQKETSKQKKALPISIHLDSIHGGLVDAIESVVLSIMQLHQHERKRLISFLQGTGNKRHSCLVKETRDDARVKLASWWTEKSSLMYGLASESNVTFQNEHLDLLEEACLLYHAQKQERLSNIFENVSENDVNVAVLADLLLKQEIHFWELANELAHQNVNQVLQTKKTLLREVRNENFNNLITMMINSPQVTEEDKRFIAAVDSKYETIREQILLFVLRMQHGPAWNSLPHQSKANELACKKKQELEMRCQMNLSGMAGILGSIIKEMPDVPILFGESKRFSHTKTTDHFPDPGSVRAAGAGSGQNPLTDIHFRWNTERESLMSFLHSDHANQLSYIERRLHLVLAHVEETVAGLEQDYEITGLSVGLAERLPTLSGNRYIRHGADIKRSRQLAKRRCVCRRLRQQEGIPLKRRPFSKITDGDNSGDPVSLHKALTSQVLFGYQDEREFLLTVLQDSNLDELRDIAMFMSKDEKHHRLNELKTLFSELEHHSKNDREESRCIIEESAAITTILRRETMMAAESETQDDRCNMAQEEVSVSQEEVSVSLLCDLQQEQDHDLAKLLLGLMKMNADELKMEFERTLTTRRHLIYKNLIMMLTDYGGVASDSALYESLERKYDAIREQLLLQITQDSYNWFAMSEKDQRHGLMELKLKVKRLCEDGKTTELLKLLGSSMLGISLHRYMGGMKDAEAEGGPLLELYHRQKLQLALLQTKLHRDDNTTLTSAEREEILLRNNNDFHAINEFAQFSLSALTVGLSEDLCQSGLMDRSRLELLSTELIRHPTVISVPTPNTQHLAVRERTLAQLRLYHRQEKSWMCQVMNRWHGRDGKNEEKGLLSLSKLKVKYELAENEEDKWMILEESIHIHMANHQTRMSADGRDNIESIAISLLADLIHMQMVEQHETIQNLTSENDSTMDGYDSMKNIAKVAYDGVDGVDGVTRDYGESDLMRAVDDKYQLLRDQLLLNALIEQVGEDAWNALTDEERQKKLIQSRLEEERLRKENLYEEASQLLGDLSLIEGLFEEFDKDTRAEKKSRLKERMKKRRERLQSGMTEEECDELDREEIKKEKCRRVMLSLEQSHNQEKEALLQQLRCVGDEMEREELRQREALRLRVEKRSACNEDLFTATALIIGAGRTNETLEIAKKNERQRQLDIARARIESLQKGKKINGRVAISTSDNTAHDNVIMALEALHRSERLYLMNMVEYHQNHQHDYPIADMSLEDIHSRRVDVGKLYGTWRDLTDHVEQNKLWNDLESGLKFSLAAIIHGTRNEVDGAEPHVILLADLQEMQHAELRILMTSILSQEEAYLRNLEANIRDRADSPYASDKIFQLLLKNVISDENDLMVVKALARKFDALREKLFIDHLIKDMGEDKWNTLSNEEQERMISVLREKLEVHDDGQPDKIEASSNSSKSKNILQSLQQSYENEKDALLASLRSREDVVLRERERQAAVVKLQHDQQKIKVASNFDMAAILLSAYENKNQSLKQSLIDERNRQKALARERLTQRKKMKIPVNQQDGNITYVRAKIVTALDDRTKDSSGIRETALYFLDRKHDDEQDILGQLLENSTASSLSSLPPQEILSKLELSHMAYKAWLKTIQRRSRSQKMSDTAKDKYIDDVATKRTELFNKLCVAVNCQIALEKMSLQTADENEIQVRLMSRLQMAQKSELSALMNILKTENDSTVKKVCDKQKRAMIEGWVENVARVLYETRDAAERIMVPGEQSIIDKMDAEFEVERKKLLAKERQSGKAQRDAKNGATVDIDAILKKLDCEQAAKRKIMIENLASQRLAMLEKLEMKKYLRDKKEEEEDAALQLIALCGVEGEQVRRETSRERQRQRLLMQERLEMRKEARRLASSRENSDLDSLASGVTSRPSTAESTTVQQGHVSRALTSQELSDDQKNAVYMQLVNQQSNLHRKISEQQTKQEQLLKQKLEDKRLRLSDEASALFSMVERQKTTLEKSQELERKKQEAQVQERVARVKYERTKTMMGISPSRQTKSFDEIMRETQQEGASTDEKMGQVAHDLDAKLRHKQMVGVERSEIAPGKDKMEIIKKRRAMKKLQRAHQQHERVSEEEINVHNTD